MHTTNTRNLFNLFGAKIALLLLFCLGTSVDSQAQIKGTYNYLDFANKPYYFGISLAYNTSQYKILRGSDFILNDSVRSVVSPRGPGFNLGIIGNLKVGQYFDFRLMPTLSFSDRRLEYLMVQGEEDLVTKRIDGVYVELPFHVRYKSVPFKDIRLFAITGVKYSFDVASNSRTRQAATLVKVAPSDFAVEYGVGMQVFFPYFIFSPEFKVSHGLTNVLIYDQDLVFSSVLDKIFSRTFTISFHFEG